MKRFHILKQISLVFVCIAMLMALCAAALPQPAQAAFGALATVKHETSYKYQAWIKDYKILVYTANFKYDHIYQLKIRDVGKGAGPWYKIDVIHLKKNTEQTRGYYLPDDLKLKRYLQICLKDQLTDQLICRMAINPGS